MNLFRKEPVIVIGMHRSGTALLVRVIEEMGVFMGGRKEKNGESIFFLRLNEWVMRQVGARWDKPEDMNLLVENKECRNLMVRFLSLFVDGPRYFSYLGLRGIAYSLFFRDKLWGWKDPRNTFTLPLWLDVFPNARVICIERNGIDVAKSLIVRQEKEIVMLKKQFDNYKYLYSLKLKKEVFGTSSFIKGIEEAVDLWYKYVRQSREVCGEIGDRCLFIKYEDFLANPRDGVMRMASFMQLAIPEEKIARISAIINNSRANAYKEDKTLKELAERYKDTLKVHDE